MLITQGLTQAATKNPSQAALRYLGKDIPYQALRSAVGRLSYLYQHELQNQQGKRIAFLTRNAPAVITAFFALSNIRCVSIPMDPACTDDELGAWLKESQATHLAVTSDLLTRARDLLRGQWLQSIPILEIEKKQGGEYDTSFTPAPDKMPLDTDTILILRTAGTSTGKPRYCAFNHLQLQHAVSCLKAPYRLQGADKVFTKESWSHPFYFIHGMLLPLLSGSTCVIDHGLENKEFLDFLQDSRVTRLIGNPTGLLKLLLICRAEQRTLRLKSLTVGMGRLAEALRKTFGLMKIVVAHCYGQTENTWSIAMDDTQSPEDPKQLLESKVGPTQRGLAGMKYKVIDESGDEITAKGIRQGQLCVSGPAIMHGYRGAEKNKQDKDLLEKLTKQTIRGSWLYTGDYCMLEEQDDGVRIACLERKESVLIKEGKAFLPEMIDKVMGGFPGVQDVAGFPIKNMKNHRVFVLAIVKTNGSLVNETDIIAHCKSSLPEEALPAAVIFTDLIPKELSGQPNRLSLSRQYAGLPC